MTFQSQYEALNKKLNEKSQHRVNNYYPIQSAIENIQIENRELQKRIFEIKNHNIKQSKELDHMKGKQKYSKQIKHEINEVGNLSVFKYGYYLKLSTNKKSLDNEKKELLLLEEMINKVNEDKTKENNTVQKEHLNEWLKILKEDLMGTNEEIFERCEQGRSQVVNIYDKKLNSRNQMKIPNTVSQSPEALPMIRNKSNLNIFLKNQPNLLKHNINLKRSGSSLYTMKNINNNVKVNQNLIKKNVLNESSQDLYELLQKKKYYDDVIDRTEKQKLELSKNYEKKIKNLSLSIDANNQRLNSIIQHNDLLKNEISGLEKILQLTKEKIKLQREVKETKIRSQNISINHYDESVTRNDLINELNSFKSEEEKIKHKVETEVKNSIEDNMKSEINDSGSPKERNTKLKEIRSKYLYMDEDEKQL